jgi:hypothetical protein
MSSQNKQVYKEKFSLLNDINSFSCGQSHGEISPPGSKIDIQDKFFIKDHMVNADETLLHCGKESCWTKKIEPRFKSGGSVEVDSKAIGSLTSFVSASGIIWLLDLCLKLLEQRETFTFKVLSKIMNK